MLPIWVGAHTGAPRWIVAVAFLFSTVLCIVLQVSLGSKVDSPRDAGVALRWTELMLLVVCVSPTPREVPRPA